MATFNFNLRGVCIEPQAKQAINYYLCVLDLPTLPNWGQYDIQVNYPAAGSGDVSVLNYTFNGDFSKLSGSGTTTYMIPVYTNQQTQNVTSVVITDTVGNTVSGNPNQGKPPVFKLMDPPRDSDFLPTTCVFSSTTMQMFFIVVMASTTPNGGYSNYFSSMLYVDQTTLQCTLVSNSGKGPVAAIGASPISMQNQIGYAQIMLPDGTGCSSLAINWALNPL